MANEKNISLDNLKTFKKKADATYAKKTDITASGLYVGKASEKSNSATTNGNTYLKLFDNDIKRSQHLINGEGATIVTSDSSGTIKIATPIKNLDTTSGSGLGNGRSENIVGSGTIYLHKVAKTGSYNDLVNKPTIPTNVVTIDTEQRISGKKYFENDVNFGKWVNPIRQVSDAPAKLNLISSAQTSAGFFDTVMFAGAGDWLYLGHLKPDFSIRASFRGTGNENDTYSANLEYTHGTLNTLTDWDYQSGWCVRPTKVSTTTPAIIQIKFTKMLYTDVLRLIITGHNLNDTGSGSAYSGFLDDYTIEVCTNYTNDTWTTVVNRTNANDSIGAGLIYSLQTASYTSCYGIRLKITKCHVTGTGYAFIKISSMQLRDYRPGIKFPDCLGAISQGGGDVWGELYTKSNLVTHNVLPYKTNESYIGNANSQYWSIYSHDFYENGTALSDKYLAKGTSSTVVNQVVYNPVEMKKALIAPSFKGESFTVSGNAQNTFALDGSIIQENGKTLRSSQLILSGGTDSALYKSGIVQDANGYFFIIPKDSTNTANALWWTETNGWKIGDNRIVTYDVLSNNLTTIQSHIRGQGDDWIWLGKVAENVYTMDLSEIKPGSSGTTTGATCYVSINTFRKRIKSKQLFKTVIDATCHCTPFELKHLNVDVTPGVHVGSKWFMPRMFVSRGAMASDAFTHMMAILYADRVYVGMTVDECSVFRDMTTALGTLNASGSVSPIYGMNADGFTLFATIMELDRDNANNNISVSGAHYRVTIFHPNTVL